MDEELIRLYVKAKATEQIRTQQSSLDRFKPGNGGRDDNPMNPEVRDLMHGLPLQDRRADDGRDDHAVPTGEGALIHDAILNYVRDELQDALIDAIPTDDPARAGVVTLGPLQGDPDPDQARISVTLHENDPDAITGATGVSALSGSWDDEVAEIECGGSETWNRRFTVKARCLLVNTGEDKDAARQIAATVRHRIEKTLQNLSFSGVEDDGEYVSRGAVATSIKGEMIQSGGPPDSFDYHIKIRFEIQTTTGVFIA